MPCRWLADGFPSQVAVIILIRPRSPRSHLCSHQHQRQRNPCNGEKHPSPPLNVLSTLISHLAPTNRHPRMQTLKIRLILQPAPTKMLHTDQWSNSRVLDPSKCHRKASWISSTRRSGNPIPTWPDGFTSVAEETSTKTSALRVGVSRTISSKMKTIHHGT